MSHLRRSMQEYLTMRRGLGFKLHEAGLRLESFVSFMEQRRARRITRSLALTWAQQSHAAQPVIRAQRLGVVRDFARYLTGIVGVPPTSTPARKSSAF